MEREWQQRAEHRLDPRAALGARHEPGPRDRGDLAAPEWHGLDEADVPVALERQGGEPDDVLLVEAADDDRIQLDRTQTGRLCGLDPGPDLRERAPAHYAREAIGVETVEMHVDPSQ